MLIYIYKNECECPKTYPLRCNPVTRRSPKIDQECCLEESDPLRENFATKRFMRTPIHIFLPSFVENLQSGDDQNAWYCSQKGGYFSLSPGPLEWFRRKFFRATFFSFPIPLPSFVQMHPVFGIGPIYISGDTQKCPLESLQYRRDREAYRLRSRR